MRTAKKKPETLEQCLAATVSEDGVDYSLATGLDMQRLAQYAKLRKKLSDKYPNRGPMEDEDDTLDIIRAREDLQAPLFLRLMLPVKAMFDRVEMLQEFATEYDKKVVRWYAHITLNWPNQNAMWLKLLGDEGVYEMVDNYFKVLRKYGVSTEEEPYYFLSPEQKRRIRHVGDMLKRTTQMDDSEIKLSILEGLQ